MIPTLPSGVKKGARYAECSAAELYAGRGRDLHGRLEILGEVHNLKNASSSASAKALAFYIAKKGARLEDLAVPAK